MTDFYFSHDYGTTNDPKVICLLSNHGGLGYAIFWRIIEMLHQDKKHILPLKGYVYSAIASQMLTTPEKVKEIIADCLEKYALFDSDGENIVSERVIRNIEYKEEKREAKVEAGRIGGIRSGIARNKQKIEEKENEAERSKAKQKEATLQANEGNEPNKIKVNKIKDIYIRDSDQTLKKILGRYKSRISKQTTSGEIVLTANIKKTLEARLQELKPLDLMIAIEGFAQDSWQMKTNGHREPGWFFQDSERLAQYIGFYNKNRQEDFIKWSESYLSD